MNNIDLKCMEKSNIIREKAEPEIKNKRLKKANVESLVDKGLGVLASDGLYAFALFIRDKKYDDTRDKISLESNILTLFKEDLFKDDAELAAKIKNEQILRNVVMKIAEDYQNLALAKDALERMLIYLRYHLKSIPDPTKEDNDKKGRAAGGGGTT